MLNCKVSNESSLSLLIKCSKGHDGGFAQKFHLDVYYGEPRKLHYNATRKEPVFLVKGLKPKMVYTIELYSFNAKGNSSKIIIKRETMSPSDLPLGKEFHEQ